MNTLPLPLGMGHSLTSITHPTTTSSSMHVLGMMPPTHQPLPKEGIYMLLLVPRISPLLRNPMKHNTPSDDFYQVHQTKHNKKPSKPLSGFQRDHSKRPPPLHPRSLLRNMMVLSMFLQKFTNSSALKLLLPSRNTILGSSTNLPRKEVYMLLTLLTLLTMNYTHLRIPLLRNNMTLINLMMHLTVRLTQFWITLTANTTKRKT